MGVHSGKFGVVNGQSTVLGWLINDLAATQSYAASNTRGGMDRKPGIRDWNGNFRQNGVNPLLLPGDTFSFSGYTAPDTDVGGTAGVLWGGEAIVDSIALTWSWADGAIMGTQVNFSANGELADSSGILSDATDPDSPIPCGTKIEYGAADTEWENLVNATLTITSANQAYVNSSSVINGECWTKRKPGVIDWTLAVTEQNNEGLPAEIALNAVEQFKLYVDDTDFWHLQWGRVGDASGLDVNRNTGAIMQRTINVAMATHDDTPTLGQIVQPGAGAAWWPFTG